MFGTLEGERYKVQSFDPVLKFDGISQVCVVYLSSRNLGLSKTKFIV